MGKLGSCPGASATRVSIVYFQIYDGALLFCLKNTECIIFKSSKLMYTMTQNIDPNRCLVSYLD